MAEGSLLIFVDFLFPQMSLTECALKTIFSRVACDSYSAWPQGPPFKAAGPLCMAIGPPT